MVESSNSITRFSTAPFQNLKKVDVTPEEAQENLDFVSGELESLQATLNQREIKI